MHLYYKLIFLWLFISACAKPSDWQRQYDTVLPMKTSTWYKVKLNDKWGLVDSSGKALLTAEYDLIGEFDKGLLRVYKGAQLGLVNSNVELVVPVGRYDIVTAINRRLWLVERDNKYTIIDCWGHELRPLIYNRIDFFSLSESSSKYSYSTSHEEEPFNDEEVLFLLQTPKQSALMTQNGAYLIPPQYDSIIPYNNVFYVVQNHKIGVWEYKDNNCRMVVAPKYDELEYINKYTVKNYVTNGASPLRFRQGKKWGLIGNAKELIPARYDDVRIRVVYYSGSHINWIEPEWNDYYEVVNNGKVGLFDYSGRLLVPCKYDDIQMTSDKNVFEVTNNNFRGLVEAGGRVLLPVSNFCAHLGSFCAGWARIISYASFADIQDIYFLNPKGEERHFYGYQSIGTFSNKGVAFAIKNNKIGLIDTAGHELSAFVYDTITNDDYGVDLGYIHINDSRQNFVYGAEIVSINEVFGLMNEAGRLVMPVRYDEITRVSADLYVVGLNGKKGLVNKYGKFITPIIYNDINFICADLYLLKLPNVMKVINTKGQLIFEINTSAYIRSDISNEGDSLLKIQHQDSKWRWKEGIVNQKGQLLVPALYDWIHQINGGYYVVRLKSRYGILSKTGKLLVPVKYTDLMQSSKDASTFYCVRAYASRPTERKEIKLPTND